MQKQCEETIWRQKKKKLESARSRTGHSLIGAIRTQFCFHNKGESVGMAWNVLFQMWDRLKS